MKQNIKYEEAMLQLEQIVQQLDNDEVSIETITEHLKTAKQLIKICKTKLIKTEDDVKKLLSEE